MEPKISRKQLIFLKCLNVFDCLNVRSIKESKRKLNWLEMIVFLIHFYHIVQALNLSIHCNLEKNVDWPIFGF